MPMMQELMQTLLSKNVLYPSLKDISSKVTTLLLLGMTGISAMVTTLIVLWTGISALVTSLIMSSI